ncbi:hypothetical protein HUK80_16870 [Flavobacterium sp. MAH-1]|uniref:Uncharacterized protein n=1 Tax=Flavobacterium agri TaxID=2743471 RepID=A0A7Y9C8N7_9FLAO|nr:hypothetical protein [Flavobacterium agri]NUY82579.1 hypothetical protein [Flavobacterium agri]NYA72602.1 hypothetical protein [Flavobacterium agri]
MKKYVFGLAFWLAFVSVSCSSDDSNSQTEDPFFNINVGSKWVYRNYYSWNDTPQAFAEGALDTVAITGTQVVQGLTFAVKTVRQGGNTIRETLVRVNNQGHLVEIWPSDTLETVTETTGLVLHPGTDSNYSYTYPAILVSDIGDIVNQLVPPATITVENNDYFAYFFQGTFTPNVEGPEFFTKTFGDHYAPGIGMIKSVNKAISGTGTYERRLISYDLQ